MKNFVLLILIFTIVFYGCKKTVTNTQLVPTPIIHSWLADSSLFGSQKIILSSTKIDDSTLSIFTKQNVVYINVNSLNGSTNGSFLSGGYYGNLIPPSLSDKIGVYPTDSNHLYIFSIKSPNSNYGAVIFTPQYSNSSTSIKGFPLAISGGGYSIINNKYVLAPTEIDYTSKIATCYLIQIDSSQGIINSTQLSASRKIYLTPPSSTIGFEFGGYISFSYFNKFFLNLSNQFFRVDTLGNVKAFGYSPVSTSFGGVSKMFSYNNYLFAQTNSDLLVSTDFGETWSLYLSLPPGSPYLSLTYQNVGNELYAYFMSQLWKVTMSGNSLTYTELDNDGLKTNQITSINKVGKYSFVSTLSGLYYRDTATFITPKK